jgi:transcriptional regulator with XRE-family HTH domain
VLPWPERVGGNVRHAREDDLVDALEPAEQDQRYARSLGDRLRRVRQQQGLSLHDVEHRSEGQLKASVVGAYERGERAVSISRLQVLASFYRVPVAELLPDPARERGDRQEGEPEVPHEVVIDLVALDQHRDTEPVLARYVESIKSRRGDYNGRVLTVRASDLDTLAAVLDLDPEELQARLAGAGIVR